MSMYLIIMEVNYGSIDADDYLCHSYYIITFYSSPYTLQADLIIYVHVISSGKILCEGTYFFPINISSSYYVLQKNKSNSTIVSLRKIINGNVNVISYDSKDVVPPSFQYISQNDYNPLSPLHIPME